jgi:hypothetical protein
LPYGVRVLVADAEMVQDITLWGDESIDTVCMEQLQTSVIVSTVTEFLRKRGKGASFKSLFCEAAEESFTVFFGRIGPGFAKILLAEIGFSKAYVNAVPAAWGVLHDIDVEGNALFEAPRQPGPSPSPAPPAPSTRKKRNTLKRKRSKGTHARLLWLLCAYTNLIC